VVSRAAGPQAGPQVAVSLRDGRDGFVNPPVESVSTLAVDGRPVTRPFRRAHGRLIWEPGDGRLLVDALVNGSELTFLDARGSILARTSLRGLKAALLHVDERQGRVGTVSAFVGRGAAPDKAAPTAPALPLITVPQAASLPGPSAPDQLTDTQLAAFRARFRCRVADPIMLRLPVRAIRLDGGHTLVLVPSPCPTGAYNTRVLAVVADRNGEARPADLEFPGLAETRHEVVNPRWSESDRQLHSFVKSRGLGDCGSSQSWVWDGRRFRLVLQTDMEECRGSLDFITTWRARLRVR
jgi:hypothetical protein